MRLKSRQLAQIFVATDISQGLRSALEGAAVIAIIMLLTSLAVKTSRTYIVRSQISEAFELASAVRTDLLVFRAQHGHWPEVEDELYSPAVSQEARLGNYVDHMTLNTDGSIAVVFGGPKAARILDGRQMTIRPVTDSPGSPVYWSCASGGPDELIHGTPGASDIQTAYLPTACREY